MLRIVADGSADMPQGWAKEFEVEILPINIHFHGQDYIQGVDINPDQFYQMVRESKCIPTTSLPSPDQIAEFYHKIARLGDNILSIHVASKMSGTFSSAQMAAQELIDDFHVVPFDSGSGSAVLAFMTRDARLMDRAGASLQEIIARLEEIRRRITVIFTLDTLEYARLSGRVSALQARVTSLLQIKPIIVLRDGLLEMADKVRTRSRSINRVLELVRKQVGDHLVNVAVVHAVDPATCELLVEMVKKCLNYKDLITTELSIAVAANLGPRTVGIAAYPVIEEATYD